MLLNKKQRIGQRAILWLMNQIKIHYTFHKTNMLNAFKDILNSLINVFI